jgi:hypothetical protein
LLLKGLYLDLGSYGQSFIPAMNIGFSYQVNKISFGSVIENLNRPNNSTGENIPVQLLAGVVYEPVLDFLFGAEITKSAQGQNIAFGAEMKPLPASSEHKRSEPVLAIGLGAETSPFIVRGGLSVMIKNIELDYSIKFHSQLKQTSIFSIGYCL